MSGLRFHLALLLLSLATLIAGGFQGAKSEQQAEQQGEEAQELPPIKVDDPRHQRDIDFDVERGAEIAAWIKENYEFTENEAYIERVSRIGGELGKIARENRVEATYGDTRLNPFNYQFFVLKGEEVNAFSVPGGYIYIYEGLIDFSETDSELAGVIAHEIAHASFRHLNELRKAQNNLSLATIPAIIAALFSKSPDAGAIIIGTQLYTQGMMSTWSVQAEKSADYGGIQYLVLSRYSPLGALTFMERLDYRRRFKPQIKWGIYETHPPSDERARTVLQNLAYYNVPLRRSLVTTSLRAVSKKLDDRTELWFGSQLIHTMGGPDAEERADRAVAKLNTFYDAVPALFELSLRNGSDIYGMNRKLFSVTEADAWAVDLSTEEVVGIARSAMKKSVFNLAYRMWPARRRALAR
ncbi:MAG: M48 family metalloprotease [Armatimonadetes bacterium]|nr:M48 family metalloprotease [Armatimonadota bacterium]